MRGNELQCIGVTLLFVFGVFLSACQKEDVTVDGFETTSLEKIESDSVFTIKILTGKVSSSLTITIAVSGTAIQEADYTFDLPASTTTTPGGIHVITSSTSNSSTSSALDRQLTVASGETYAELSFQLINDKFIEPRSETIYFQIIDVSDADVYNALKNKMCVVAIQDDDQPPSDGLQVDLSWSLNDGSLFNTADFDMYLANNVVISNSQVTSKELISSVSSTSKTSLESLTLGSSLPNDTYYVVIRFISGSADATIEIIASEGDSYSRASGRILSSDVGRDFYYGPIVKSGNNYSGRKTSPAIIISD
jgi:hypothetical protein